MKQRLVVCLDGTWNNKDDSTNVIHHFALAVERPWPDANAECNQTRYYGEGVGTGVLDGISGGGFGFGLEENVRAAYDWLVEHYHDEDDGAGADEIYVFGFSRGAYTARSLVGFIGTVGLLRRGAPLSVNQLWQEYCLLGREREHRTSFWDRIFGESPANIRRINDLIVDPWKVAQYEKKRVPNAADDPHRVSGQLVNDLKTPERLLVRWSRRIRVTYLGVYDTVGAVGIDALAIPGLKSKLAMHHNLNVTTLVQQCRHALALDEHRSSFSHTPLAEFIGHGEEEEDNQLKAMKEDSAETYWARKHAMWQRKVEQRWFAGAHSNIGGGYPDNELAQRPLEWLLEGARKAGLECSDLSFPPPASMPKPRDSYSEFAKPFWTEIIRGKRFYRMIDPAAEMKASGKKATDKDQPPAGFSMQSINEQIDSAALAWAAHEPDYLPPNLCEYARRKLAAEPDCAAAAALRLIADRKPEHSWLGTSAAPHLILALWATFAAVGLIAMNELFTAHRESPSLCLLIATAFVFVLVDWGESRTNFHLAARGLQPWRRALLDSIYWLRTLGFVLFAFGCATALVRLFALGWYGRTFPEVWTLATSVVSRWWTVPIAAGTGVTVASLLDGARGKRRISGVLGGLFAGPAAAIGIVLFVIFLARLFGYVFTPAFGYPHAADHPAAVEAEKAGLLILLQLAFGYLLNALDWIGAPMSQANLGSILPLQLCATPGGVAKCLERWRIMLACRWSEADRDPRNGPAARTLRKILREALWRDIFGFIPVYASVLLFGLWFGAHELGWLWLSLEYLHLPLWLWLPLAAAVADWLEDACHLRYLALHQCGRQPPAFLPLLSTAMTTVKFIALLTGLIPAVWAAVMGTLNVMDLGEKTGWRGTVALLISAGAMLALLAVVLGALIYRIRTWRRNRDGVPPVQSNP